MQVWVWLKICAGETSVGALDVVRLIIELIYLINRLPEQ
jgi:hypothetical protein